MNRSRELNDTGRVIRTVSLQIVSNCAGGPEPCVMSVLLHRHVQDRNVSRLGAWAFSVAGKAIATNAQIVLSDEEMKRRRAVGS